MPRVSPDCLTERHLRLFGAIIQWFARYELLMQEVMAKVAGSDPAAVMLLTRDLDFGGKRDAMLRLLRHRMFPLDQYDHIHSFLNVPHAAMPLRDDIAHSGWIESEAPASIQPNWILRMPRRVEPLRDEPGGRSGNFIDRNPEQSSYSLDDLAEIVENLAANHERFAIYLHEAGLVGEGRRE